MNEVFYPRLVSCFYSNFTYEDGKPIKAYVNRVEIRFGVRELCEILEIEDEGISIYEFKS